ncbi:T3SS effector HopA1 family protein [Sphaerisporangium fuscum]|uniref:T3SS effector HopA1 family protein n=1 Tax=Sphaerisporangium fuscum TaxID=2835868 RepID=UPI001BDBDBD9|nr:T3SS effector HopA1 family protein [Sphaerisporangium fuscum]
MRRLLDRVRISPDLTSATVDDREVGGDGPRTLRGALSIALYDAFHAGQKPRETARRKSLRDPGFEQALRAMVPHRDSRVLAPLVPGTADVVRLHGVRVLVPAARLGAEAETPGGPARWVGVPAVLPALSPGFLLVNGSLGHDFEAGSCVRLYVGAETPDAAPGLWGALLGRLEDLQVPYRAKVLSARDLYPRRDSIVVYLGRRSWHVVPELTRAATAAGGLRRDVSAYVAELAGGVGWGWEPQDPRPGMRGLSFGEHRSQAVAAGLLAHAEHGGDRDRSVTEALLAAGITPGALHRNLTSPAVPFETSGPGPGPGSDEEHERR